jgi:hypothetical protein
MRIILWLIGFVVGAGIAVAAEALLFLAISGAFDRQFMPRGLGWLAMPILAGIAGARIAPLLPALLATKMPELARATQATRHRRFMLVGAVGWMVIFALYWVTAQPYGYRMYGEDWTDFLELFLLPPTAFIAVCIGLLWANTAKS